MSTVLTTSMPTVIDALLTQWRALAMTDAAGMPLQIFDGFPGPNTPDDFVQIGGFQPETANGAQSWQSLGGTANTDATRDEEYDVHCLVTSFVGGTDALASSSTSDAQKTARTRALGYLVQIEKNLRDDPKLTSGIGGNGLGTGWVSFGTDVRLEQSWPGSQDHNVELGRAATFVFTVHVYKRLYAS